MEARNVTRLVTKAVQRIMPFLSDGMSHNMTVPIRGRSNKITRGFIPEFISRPLLKDQISKDGRRPDKDHQGIGSYYSILQNTQTTGNQTGQSAQSIGCSINDRLVHRFSQNGGCVLIRPQ